MVGHSELPGHSCTEIGGGGGGGGGGEGGWY